MHWHVCACALAAPSKPLSKHDAPQMRPRRAYPTPVYILPYRGTVRYPHGVWLKQFSSKVRSQDARGPTLVRTGIFSLSGGVVLRNTRPRVRFDRRGVPTALRIDRRRYQIHVPRIDTRTHAAQVIDLQACRDV